MLHRPVQIHRKRFARPKQRAAITDGFEANAVAEAGGLRQQRSRCELLQNLHRSDPANVAQPHVIVNAFAKNTLLSSNTGSKSVRSMRGSKIYAVLNTTTDLAGEDFTEVAA